MSLTSRYELGAEIKRSPKGSVFQATHRMLGRTVAIRILNPYLPLAGEAGLEIRAVIQSHAALVHPNIGRVIDADLDCDQPYLVMDYFEGGSLRDRISSRSRSAANVVADLLLVLNAVTFAHASGILHRDLRPGNVLYDELDIPHVVDFGFDVLDTGMPGEKRSMFSGGYELAYRSLELFKDPLGHTEATDLYSIGMMLYVCLAGELPGRETLALNEVADVPFEVDEFFARLTGRFDPFRSSREALAWALASPGLVRFVGVFSVLGPLFKDLFKARRSLSVSVPVVPQSAVRSSEPHQPAAKPSGSAPLTAPPSPSPSPVPLVSPSPSVSPSPAPLVSPSPEVSPSPLASPSPSPHVAEPPVAASGPEQSWEDHLAHLPEAKSVVSVFAGLPGLFEGLPGVPHTTGETPSQVSPAGPILERYEGGPNLAGSMGVGKPTEEPAAVKEAEVSEPVKPAETAEAVKPAAGRGRSDVLARLAKLKKEFG